MKKRLRHGYPRHKFTLINTGSDFRRRETNHELTLIGTKKIRGSQGNRGPAPPRADLQHGWAFSTTDDGGPDPPRADFQHDG